MSGYTTSQSRILQLWVACDIVQLKFGGGGRSVCWWSMRFHLDTLTTRIDVETRIIKFKETIERKVIVL